MKNRIELFKSILLFFLVVSSMFLTLAIAGYRPDYEILGISGEKQREEQTREKLQQNTLNLLSPYIITRSHMREREEAPLAEAITKLRNVDAVKDKAKIKEMLGEIANSTVEEIRIRNKSIDEVIGYSNTRYVLEYKYPIDTLSSKLIYLGNNNQASDFDFKNVLFSSENKHAIYLYSEENDGYMQIEFNEDIYTKIENIFNKNFKEYGKYNIDNRFNFYVQENVDNYYINEYNGTLIDLANVSSNIFIANSNLKVSELENGIRESTDGYSILRELSDTIKYINPSNIIDNNNIILTQSMTQSMASNFLIVGYLPDIDYRITSIESNKINYQEVYQDGLAFSKDITSSIRVQTAPAGINNITIPRIVRETHIATYQTPMYSVENTSAMLNYLFKNILLQDIQDIELGYEKTYSNSNKKIIYTPAWYINYKGEYIKFKDLQKKIDKGEL